jgi:two-component system chemotaxis response regulator CheB
LLSAQSEALDGALWSAFRALEENAALARRIAERARKNHRRNSAKLFEQRAESAERQAARIRELLLAEKNSETP